MSLRVIWQYMNRSIYCHMTLSAMIYLLYSNVWIVMWKALIVGRAKNSNIVGFFSHLSFFLFHFRSSEKRKEKSRDAARNRRSQEADIFNQLCGALPVPSNIQAQLDKSSVMRIAISHLKLSKIKARHDEEGDCYIIFTFTNNHVSTHISSPHTCQICKYNAIVFLDK